MSTDQPVTEIVSRIVHSGREDDFRAWADRLADLAERNRGYRDGLRLEQTGGVFHLVHRFAAAADLDAWRAEPDYVRLQAEGDAFSTPRRQLVSGERPMVKLPGEADSTKWKRAAMTWAAVYPLLLLLNGLVAITPLTDWPKPLTLALTSLAMTSALTWIILPRISRWLKPWVMRDADGQAQLGG